MSKWDGILGRLFRGAFGRGAARGLSAAAPRLTRAGGELFAGHVARSTFRIFKNNCLTLPWIEEGDELDAAVDGARADLLRSWNAYRESFKSRRASAQAEDDWRRVLSDFRRHVADLNRRIAAYNLKAPSARFRRRPVDAELEIRRVASER